MTSLPVKVYGFPLSQPTRSVLLLCKEAGISFDFVLIDGLKGENRKKEYLDIYPVGFVPIIQEDAPGIGGVLGESSAILQYLAESRKLESWYPNDPIKKSRVNFWLSWHHTNSRSATKKILRIHVFKPEDMDKIIAAGVQELTKSLEFVEGHLLRTGNRFLEGSDHPTIADIMILPELDQLDSDAFALFDFSPFPRVQQWMRDLKGALPHYNEVFAPVIDLAARYKAGAFP
jgi:glutathione S-transferase